MSSIGTFIEIIAAERIVYTKNYNFFISVYSNVDIFVPLLGYEPAELTVLPPPQTVEGGFIFSYCV